ncbi:arylsulfatase [Labilibacter sediminis]|nr:arylsulfatase [Labilibacter sediminis]
MKVLSYTITVLFFSLIFVSCQKKKVSKKPNIIYILADDLGYGELGCYGQQRIETPNIDQLAKAGMSFTQHYSGAPVCAPSRAVLLTGKHLGHSPVRGNDEWAERGEVWNYRAMINDQKLEGQRPLPENEITIGKLLQQAGYTTGIVGKWGLGAPNTCGEPSKQGFDFFYGYNCQRQAHTYYPVHLYKNNRRVYLKNDTIEPNKLLESKADPYDINSYKNFMLKDYAPDLMFDELLNFVEENKGNPFFMYWAAPMPHVPLQAPKKWVDYYVEKFGEEEPYLGEDRYFPTRYPKATYAAMVSYFDEQIGILVNQLKELGLYDNTLIIFTSDNGATYNGGTNSEWFNSGGIFNAAYGRGKGFLYEGGIRVPMIAVWKDKIDAGSSNDHISSFYDVLPTLCDIAEMKTPQDVDGLSFLPTLLGEEQKAHEFLYWEFAEYDGQVAVRMGDWKVTIQKALTNKPSYELYNLIEDPRELNNLAESHPEIMKKAQEIMIHEHKISYNKKWHLPLLGD